MDKILCEGCSAPLRLDRETCESCRRPWSQDELDRARERASEAARRRRRIPVVILAWSLAAVAAAGLYQRREVLLGLAAGVKADFVHEMNAQGKIDPNKPLSPMAQQLIGAMHVNRDEPKTVTVAAETRSPLVKEPPRVAHRPPEPQAPPTHLGAMTRMYGVVYDMNTAAPVAGASVIFRGPGGMAWPVSTDADGFYVVDVPTNIIVKGDMAATVTASGYKEGQLEDADPPYFERSVEQRLDALSQLAPSDLEPFPVRGRASSLIMPLDVVLVPLAGAAR